MPGASPEADSAKPDRVNCDPPNRAATSGRSIVSVVAPTKTGAPDGGAPNAGSGNAQTWTASMPAPEGDPGSSVHPEIANGCTTVWLRAGRSSDMTGRADAAVTIRAITPLL